MNNKKACCEELSHKFKCCGLKLTGPRQAIIKILQNTKEHLSAEDIYIKVHKKHPNIGLMTVYRTLDILTKMKIVYKFDFGDKRARYEIIRGDKTDHHHHLVCSDCCKIIDYDDFINEEIRLMSKIEKKLSKKFDFNINNHVVQFYGICRDCAGKN